MSLESKIQEAVLDAYILAAFRVESNHQFVGDSGQACLCGFSSARARSRTEHITWALRGDLFRPEGDDHA